MTKKGPLGTAEIFYVKEHLKSQDISQIAKDLDRPLVTIQRLADEVEQESPTITAGELMARREGVVTMTENASALSERKKKSSTKPKECTTKIKHD